MRNTVVCILVLCFNVLLCHVSDGNISTNNQKSLDYFLRKKTIHKSRITVLNTANDEINYTWIEYHYLYDDTDTTYGSEHNLTDDFNLTNLLNVYFNPMECTKTRGHAYSYFIQNLLEVILFSNQNSELQVIQADSSNETIDLLTCASNAPIRNYDVAIFNNYYPLYAILSSRYALVYKKQNKAKDIFVLTFVGTLWLCFLVILFLLAVCLRISTHYYSRIYNGRRWSWVEITLWAIAAACQQGLSYTPSRVTSRIFFLMGYITSYVLYTAFTAAITSVLVQQETVDVAIGDFNIIGYGTGSKFGSYKIASHTNNLTKVFEQVDTGANVGLGPQIFFDKHIAHISKQETIPETNVQDDYKVITLDKSMGLYQESFFMRKGLQNQQKTINLKLIKLFESGILKQIKHKSLKTLTTTDVMEGYSSATIEHVKSAILLFLIGVGLSMAFLIMELGVYGYRHRVTEQT